MSRVPDSFIQELLNRVDIVDVVRQYVPTLRHQGKEWGACCPFHQEKTPSFTVSPQKQFYYCFGCGAAGNAIGFLMNHAHLSFMEAIESLAATVGMTIPLESGEKAQAANDQSDALAALAHAEKFFKAQLKRSPHAIEYLKKRGLSGDVCATFGIGYAPPEWDALLKSFTGSAHALQQAGLIIQNDKGRTYDRFRDRIMFPIRDKRGRTIGFGGRVLDSGEPKYLNSPETPFFHKGSQLYGLYECLKAQPQCTSLLLVEGYMDVVSLAQYGVCHVVAALGTALTAQHLMLALQRVNEVVICFDGDAAGKRASLRAMELALPLVSEGHQIKFLFLPQGDDPDSFIRKEGRENFLKRVAQSQHLSSMLIEHLLSQVDLSSLDGRARLAELTKPYLEKIGSEVYRSLLLEELSRYTRLDAGTLRSTLKLRLNYRTSSEPVVNRQRSIVERAIGFLLRQPTLIRWLPATEVLVALPEPDIKVLAQLADLIVRTGATSAGQILGVWPDEQELKYLAELAATPSILSEKESEEEFKGLIVQLKKRLREVEMTYLAAKAKSVGLDGLTEPERQLIRNLLINPDIV